MNLVKYIDRKNTDCAKWDGLEKSFSRGDLLAMWVADMDFQVPECVRDALKEYVDMGAFGYYVPPAAYYDAFIEWEKKYHGYEVEREWMRFAPGVVPAFNWLVQLLAGEGEAVAVMQPVYYPFSEAIRQNGRELVNCQLHYEDGRYSIDFEDMERKLKAKNVKALIFCSPHNPVGRVWTEEEVRKVADLCLENDVILMVDEIHSDFIFPGHSFFSCMRLDEKYRKNLAFYSSPGKTFNIAGLQSATIVIPDETLRAKYRQANREAGYSQANVMGQAALIACYNLGADWVDELVEYIYGNVQYVKGFIAENLPKAKVVDPDGTYLLWVDFSGYGISQEELEHRILDKAKLWLDAGAIFGPETALFERFNLATPRSVVEEAMGRLKLAFEDQND